MATPTWWWPYHQMFPRVRCHFIFVCFPFPNFNIFPQDTIDQIKFLMTEASRELMIASRHRAYFKQVKILLPKTWTSVPHDQTLQGEFFEDAEIRVDR